MSFGRDWCGVEGRLRLRGTHGRNDGRTDVSQWLRVGTLLLFCSEPTGTKKGLIPNPPVAGKAAGQAFLLLLNKGTCNGGLPGD